MGKTELQYNEHKYLVEVRNKRGFERTGFDVFQKALKFYKDQVAMHEGLRGRFDVRLYVGDVVRFHCHDQHNG